MRERGSRCKAPPEDRPDTAHDVAEELRWMREPGGQAAPKAVPPGVHAT